MLSVVAQQVWPPTAPVECLGSTSPAHGSFVRQNQRFILIFLRAGGPTVLAKIQKNSGQVRPAAKKEGVGCCKPQLACEAFLLFAQKNFPEMKTVMDGHC
ncbi:MAG: hypothetical protein EZS28_024401 [Streblomastix strix]|uniref:Uncharacterized protein n=1 Tax=Streblomastix strix TaxID=222440 RepID=A0A5J4VC27_9EUKA|nr:MAG: hypothetical protein EZS28_024401 [Streblomastix strix]